MTPTGDIQLPDPEPIAVNDRDGTRVARGDRRFRDPPDRRILLAPPRPRMNGPPVGKIQDTQYPHAVFCRGVSPGAGSDPGDRCSWGLTPITAVTGV